MQIGARTALWLGGAKLPTARDYVQDGLIAMWDGTENAGWGVHDPNAIVWKDLSGSGYDLNVVDVNGWQEDCAYVNGLFAKTSNVIEYDQIAFAESSVDIPNYGGVVFWTDGTRENVVGRQKFIAPYANVTTNLAMSYGKPGFVNPCPCNGTISCSYIPYKSYFNTIELNKSSTVYSPNALSNEMVIGARSKYNGSYGFYLTKSKVRCIRIYSRELTSSEIAANYAIDKARFGLT